MDLITFGLTSTTVLSVIGLFWNKIKPHLPKFGSGAVLPHTAVTSLLDYFKSTQNNDGIKAATDCGKLLYESYAKDSQGKK